MDQRQKQGVMGTAVNGFRAAGNSVAPGARLAMMGTIFQQSVTMDDPFQMPVPFMDQPPQFGPTGTVLDPFNFFETPFFGMVDIPLGFQFLTYLAMADALITVISLALSRGNLHGTKFMPLTRGVIKAVAGIDPLNWKKNVIADSAKGLDAETGAQTGAEKASAGFGKSLGFATALMGFGLGFTMIPAFMQSVGLSMMYSGMPLYLFGASMGALLLPLSISLALGLVTGQNKAKKLSFAATGVAAYGLAAMETGASNFLPGAEMMAGNETIAGLSSTFTEAAMGFSSTVGNMIGGFGMHMVEGFGLAGTQAGSALAGGSQWLMQAMADPTGALITTAIAAFIVYKGAKAAYNMVKSDKKKKGPAPKGTEAAA